jgi:hypothetical protein
MEPDANAAYVGFQKYRPGMSDDVQKIGEAILQGTRVRTLFDFSRLFPSPPIRVDIIVFRVTMSNIMANVTTIFYSSADRRS